MTIVNELRIKRPFRLNRLWVSFKQDLNEKSKRAIVNGLRDWVLVTCPNGTAILSWGTSWRLLGQDHCSDVPCSPLAILLNFF